MRSTLDDKLSTVQRINRTRLTFVVDTNMTVNFVWQLNRLVNGETDVE